VRDPERFYAKAITYEDRVLAYVDILGWSDFIARSIKDPEVMVSLGEAVRQLASSEERLRVISRSLRDAKEGSERAQANLEVAVFSDTVVISSLPNAFAVRVLVAQLQKFCRDLMMAGLFTRGAIVRGPLFHSDNVIFGPALVEAHRLESDVAKYPRVLVSDALMPGLATMPSGDLALPREVVEVDRDLCGFLNVVAPEGVAAHFRAALAVSARETVTRELARHSDAGIRAKLGWLMNFLHGYVERTQREASDVDAHGDGEMGGTFTAEPSK
jgi:hypothetical protein